MGMCFLVKTILRVFLVFWRLSNEAYQSTAGNAVQICTFGMVRVVVGSVNVSIREG
jgi:hypothetical protein